MKEKEQNISKKDLQAKVKALIEKSKKLNMIKPLSTAFETTPCKDEIHKGNQKYFVK